MIISIQRWLVFGTVLCFTAGAYGSLPEELDCVIEPDVVIDLASRVDGIVETIVVDRGDFVEEDQVLVQLEASVEKAAVARARARANATAEVEASNISVGFAERRHQRVRVLHRDAAISTDQLDETSTETDLSRFRLQQARENQRIALLDLRQSEALLNRHTVRSPIRGVVTKRYLSPGESVEEQPILRLAKIDPLRVEVIVPVTAFGSLDVGQNAVVRPEAPKEGNYSAKITVVDQVADAASGTFRVRLSLPNPDYELPSGLKCRVQFLPTVDSPPTNRIATEAMSESPLLPVKSVPRLRADAARCRTIGPIENLESAQAMQTAIAARTDSVALRKVAGDSGDARFRVLTRPQASIDDAQALATKMRSAGITDLFVFGPGPSEGRVSLGLYADRKFAESRQSDLLALGFETDLHVKSSAAAPRYWLDFELASNTDVAALAADPALGGAQSVPASCDAVLVKND